MFVFNRILGVVFLFFACTLVSCGKSPDEGVLPKEKEDDSIVRILAIGNSFSMDATERHFRELAETNGIKLLIANMYISGATLQMHWNNARNNSDAYEYRVIDENGVLTSLKGVSLQRALIDQKWDYVSFQNGPISTGEYGTYSPLPSLFDYVKERVSNHTKFIFHQTWAYARNSTQTAFERFNYNQEAMYNGIVDATTRVHDLVDFDVFVPAGTAIQNGRTSSVGDNFTRDGYHLNELGRYTAACTWFEAVFEQSVIGNSYRPDGISENEATIGQHAAHTAISNPYEVTVLEEDPTVRILAIGNSFSMDATERYLRELADAKGVKVVIANMYISGASLQMHWNNVQANSNAYEYRVISEDGVLTSLDKVSLQKVLVDQKWDYISFQQSSASSGQYETYQPLPALFNYVKERVSGETKFIFHQTWAYAQNSTQSGFERYNNDQATMFNGIVDASSQAYGLVDFDIFVPAGTAIQNGRTSSVGDNFTRDGYHLNELGRYTAACTWFEAIFQQSVIGNSYRPTAISEQEAVIARSAAHAAIGSPYEVTTLDD